MDIDVSDDSSALRLGRAFAAVLAFAAYLGAAVLSDVWRFDAGPTPLWLPTGVAGALALVVRRADRWLVVAGGLAAVVVHAVAVRDDPSDRLWLVGALALELVVAVAVFGLVLRHRTRLGRTGLTLVAFVACFVVVTVPALLQLASDPAVDSITRSLWTQTVVGHGLGLAATGMVVLLSRGPGDGLIGADPLARIPELTLGLGVVAVFALFGFAGRDEMMIPILAVVAWLAVRFGPRVGMPIAASVVFYASWRTSGGHGHLAEDSDPFAQLAAFNASVLLTAAMISRYARGIDRERRRHHAVLASLPDLVTITDLEVGGLEEVTPRRWTRTIEPLLSEQVVRMLEERHRVGDSADVTTIDVLRDEDGDRRFIESRTVDVDALHRVTLSRDMTEHHELLEALREAQERWQRLARNAWDGFVEVDADGRISYITEQWAEMIGATRSDLVGHGLDRLVRPDDWPHLEPYAASILAGERITLETRVQRIGAGVRWVLVSGEPLLDDDGAFRGAVLFLEDTTEQHRAQLGQVEAELRLASVETLERQRIARAIHDGPLQSLVALSYRLNALKNRPGDDTDIAQLEQMSIDAMAGIRTTLQRLEQPAVDKGRLAGALGGAADRFLHNGAPSLEVRDETITEIPERAAVALYQTGTEAIVNAVLHSNATRITATIRDLDAGYELAVLDDGEGFDLDALTSMHGHLGMRAMRQRAVEAGGQCVVSPRRPRGTRVTIWVPRQLGHARTQPITAEEHAV